MSHSDRDIKTMREIPRIRIGMPTSGEPIADGNRLLNLLIGKGFHWQRTITATLPGSLRIYPERALAVNTIDIEEYLRSVVGSEMNPDSPTDLLKAHAVISRSWAMLRLQKEDGEKNGDCEPEEREEEREQSAPGKEGRATIRIWGWEDDSDHHGEGFDVCSDDHCQRYQGLQPISEAAREAIDSTCGIVLTDERGRIADCRFSKCCGGRTELFSSCWQDEDPEYLQSRDDRWCDLSDLPPSYRQRLLRSVLKDFDTDCREETALWGDWEARIGLDELRSRLIRLHSADPGEIKSVRPLQRGASGRIIRLLISGEKADIEIGKELRIRRLLAPDCLMSSAFTPSIEGDTLIMRGRGWGHGVGLCQIGAARMASEGKDWREILAHYYPGTEIRRLY